MQPPKLTHDNNELVIQKEVWINLILGVPAISLFAICLFSNKSTKRFFKENQIATIAVILIILAALFYLIRRSLDSRVKMVINKEGIWTSSKGLLLWSNIQYYYFDEIKSDYDTAFLLKIRLNQPDKEIIVDISFFNTCEKEIANAIANNSGDYNIIALKENY